MRRYIFTMVFAVALMLILVSPAGAQEATETPVAPTPTTAPLPPIETVELQVVGLRVEPLQAEEGTAQDILVEITNPGEAPATTIFELEVDGQVFETRELSLDAGARETLTFTAPSLGTGDHTVVIGGTEARFQTSSPAVASVDEPANCILRQGMQVRLQNVVGTIKSDQDGHLELSFRNPPVNDCTVQADLRITVPQNIIPIAKEGAISGAAGTLNAFVEVPSGSERALIMDFKGESTGDYFISFNGTYWPEGQKDLFQPITLQQKLVVEEPSDDLSVPPIPTTPDQEVVVAAEDAGLLGGLPPMWLIVIVLVILVVIVALVAIVGLGRRGGGTTVITE